jgi:hypothetical protein
MTNYFIYSVLQYKHSLTLGESLNVGILFYFPVENIFEFVSGEGSRAKAIYPDFDNTLFNGYLKAIIARVKKHIDLFNEKPIDSDFAKYVHANILAEDAAGLIFREPVHIKNVFVDRNKAIEEFSKILLPGINTAKPAIIKHNEIYIIKKFNGYILRQDKTLESRFNKNEMIKTKHFNIKFDLSWQQRTHNYIKPISFDFTDEASFQTKAAIFYSYITDLAEYAKANKARFDFLIAKPQVTSFNRAYENALDFLNSAKAPKQLITEDQLEMYSQNVLSDLAVN